MLLDWTAIEATKLIAVVICAATVVVSETAAEAVIRVVNAPTSPLDPTTEAVSCAANDTNDAVTVAMEPAKA